MLEQLLKQIQSSITTNKEKNIENREFIKYLKEQLKDDKNKYKGFFNEKIIF